MLPEKSLTSESTCGISHDAFTVTALTGRKSIAMWYLAFDPGFGILKQNPNSTSISTYLSKTSRCSVAYRLAFTLMCGLPGSRGTFIEETSAGEDFSSRSWKTGLYFLNTPDNLLAPLGDNSPLDNASLIRLARTSLSYCFESSPRSA